MVVFKQKRSRDLLHGLHLNEPTLDREKDIPVSESGKMLINGPMFITLDVVAVSSCDCSSI